MTPLPAEIHDSVKGACAAMPDNSIQWLHQDIEQLRGQMQELMKSNASLMERLRTVEIVLESRRPEPRPCRDFVEHVNEHRRVSDRWWNVCLRVLAQAIIAAMAAAWALSHILKIG